MLFGFEPKYNKEHLTIVADTIVDFDISNALYNLPSQLEETSGLIYYKNLLWSFNDSGGDPVIYAFKTKTGEIVKTIRIKNAENVDWEEISQDKHYIYIGDFGNNAGNRKDLCIYKVKKSDIPEGKNVSVESTVLNFYYENQEDFTEKFRNSAYDCEAMAVLKNHIYLFTKNWQTRETSVYKISDSITEQKAVFVSKFNIGGLVTGAAISPDNKQLAILGYQNFKPFFWIFSDFKQDDFFNCYIIRINLSSIFNAQTEGIVYTTNDSIYISCEKSFSIDRTLLIRKVHFPQQMFHLSTSQWERLIYPSILERNHNNK